MGGVAGQAGLFATADAIARYGQAWLAVEPTLGIDPELVREAVCDQTEGLDVTHGLGWQVRGDRSQDEGASHLTPLSHGAFGHTGFTGTSIAIDPDRELVIVLLTNRVYASRTHEGIDALRRRLYAAIIEAAGPG
jgi:CubicO group peptidase (beta-lactamase class C family)